MDTRKMVAMAAMVVLVVFIGFTVWAVPGIINNQGKLTNANGDLLNGTYTMTFKIYDDDIGGTLLWTELQSVAVTNGIYDVQLGATTTISPDIFSNDTLYIEVSILNPATQTNEILTPRQQLTSSPYAMRADVADSVVNGAVTTNMLSNDAITSAKIQDGQVTSADLQNGAALTEILDNDGSGSNLDADRIDNLDSSQLQRRVTGTCATGSSIRVINSDGTVACEIDDTGSSGETDPEVGSNTLNYVPKWNGSALVTGSIFDTGALLGVGTTAPQGKIHAKVTSGVINLREGILAKGDADPIAGVYGYGNGTYYGVYGLSFGGYGIYGKSDGAFAGGFDGGVSITTEGWGYPHLRLSYRSNPIIYSDILQSFDGLLFRNFYEPPSGDTMFSFRIKNDEHIMDMTSWKMTQFYGDVRIKGGRWDLTNSNGDLYIGDLGYALKFGVAIDGAGAGNSFIRATGGKKKLLLGSGLVDDVVVVSDANDGRVGIGIYDPAYGIDVDGGGRFLKIVLTSDERLKKNVSPIEEALQKVCSLRGVEFEWKAEEFPEKKFEEGKKLGLIAQEVEKILPEVVATADTDGYKSVEYANIVPVLIEAVKELKAQNDELKSRIEALESGE